MKAMIMRVEYIDLTLLKRVEKTVLSELAGTWLSVVLFILHLNVFVELPVIFSEGVF